MLHLHGWLYVLLYCILFMSSSLDFNFQLCQLLDAVFPFLKFNFETVVLQVVIFKFLPGSSKQ